MITQAVVDGHAQVVDTDSARKYNTLIVLCHNEDELNLAETVLPAWGFTYKITPCVYHTHDRISEAWMIHADKGLI